MSELTAMTHTISMAAYGSWLSPISAADVAAAAKRLSNVAYDRDGKTLYWLEGRPQEGGRLVIVRRSSSGTVEDVSPEGVNVRTLAHEYGGGAYGIADGVIYYSNFADQAVYKLDVSGSQPEEPVRVSALGDFRFADFQVDTLRKRVLCVLEDHTGIEPPAPGEPAVGEPINCLASLDSEVAEHPKTLSEPMMLTCGYDFFAFPRLSPDGKRLAYMAWKHPNMPWDDSVLFTAEVGMDGSLSNHRKVAGGQDCSVFQPSWGADGTLYFISDESGYWQIKAIRDFYTMDVLSLISDKAYADCEFGLPMWVFAQSTYALTSANSLVCTYNRRGLWHLAKVDFRFEGEEGIAFQCHSTVTEIEAPYSEYAYLAAGDGKVAMLAGSATLPNSVVEYDLAKGSFETIVRACDQLPDTGYLTSPEVIEFPTEGGKTAFAFYYAPKNADFRAESGAPPLLVKCHGGPTGAASSLLSLGIQYWTSRGFAVVDVNYGGSTGFGRAYRKRLNGNWGIVDVADCENAVKYLVSQGKADAERVAISGGSAGGFTVLCALTFKKAFRAGASHYGIGDLEALVRDTHKFESRYLDNLVGPYPFSKHVYEARSPQNHVDKLSCPAIFFQGLEDKVVPPNQAEAMVKALRKKKIPVVYIAYEGEQHGFRKAENIIRTMESELAFFLRVFGIEHKHPIPTLEIENLSK